MSIDFGGANTINSIADSALNTVKDLRTKAFTGNSDVSTAWKHYAVAAGMYTAFGFPDVMLSGLPLHQVQSVEFGISQDLLKYRAIKGEFLAHQPAQRIGVLINCLLTGPFQEVQLSMIEGIQVSGEVPKYGNVDLNMTSEMLAKIQDYGEGALADAKAEIERIKKEKTMWKNTFTFISRTQVWFNMYIQSLIVNRSVAQGSRCIDVSITLRKFIAPPVVFDMSRHRRNLISDRKATQKAMNQKTKTAQDLVDKGTELYKDEPLIKDKSRVNLKGRTDKFKADYRKYKKTESSIKGLTQEALDYGTQVSAVEALPSQIEWSPVKNLAVDAEYAIRATHRGIMSLGSALGTAARFGRRHKSSVLIGRYGVLNILYQQFFHQGLFCKYIRIV